METYKTTSDYAKEIRTALKENFPSMKFSVIKRHYSSISITLLSSELNLLSEEKSYEQINECWIENIQNISKRILFGTIDSIVHDICQITYRETGDYGTQPSMYINYSIGNFDKPYQVK